MQAGVELTRHQNPVKAIEIDSWLALVEASSAVLPMDSACFREWARLKSGKSTELMEDAMIVATARVHDLEIATRNQRDFLRLGISTFNPFAFEG